MHVSVVIPCYRSEGTLEPLVTRLLAVLTEISSQHEVLLVVDGSPDNTWRVAKSLTEQHATVRAMRLSRNYGQHNAILAGLREARFETILTLDDDLQHLPEEIPRLLTGLSEDIDLVYGIPFQDEHGHFRNTASRVVKAFMTRGLGIDNARSLSAFRAFRSHLLSGFAGLSGPHASIDVALSWSTNRVASVSVRMDQRTEGRSNYSFRLLVRHALNMLLGYSVLPLRAVGYLGGACALVGLGLLAYVLWRYISGAITVPGFASLASMIAVFSGAQMLAIAIVGEYLGRIHASNMGRPTYLVSEVAAFESGSGQDPRGAACTVTSEAAGSNP